VTTTRLSEKASGFDVAIGGIVSSVRPMRTKKGEMMAVILLEDLEGVVEVLVFPDTYTTTQKLILPDAPLLIKGKLDNDESAVKVLATDIYPMERVREMLSRTVTIHINVSAAPSDIAERLQPVIDEKKGLAEIVFELEFPGRYTALVRPNPYVRISPDREFVESVERLCGKDTVRLG
jgi:DNA polymerase-3 subunit alpha